MTAFAANATGSITLICRGKLEAQTVPMVGDRYALVLIAQGTVDSAAGTVRYTTCEAFREYDCDWAGLRASQAGELARKLAEVVAKTGNYERQGTTDQNGIVTFSDLPAGLYLLVRVHTEPANEKFRIDPCFQYMPQIVNGSLIYQVEVSPKYVVEKPELPPDLPKTGQLNWPIPVLLVSGTVLFLTGMEMRYGRRKPEDAE